VRDVIINLGKRVRKMNLYRTWFWLVVFMALAAVGGATVLARPPYPAIFQEHYAKNEPVALAAKESKCNVCHTPAHKNPFAGGKPRNPYGLALAKYLGGKDFQRLKNPEQKMELAARVKDALKAVEMEKGPGGTPFGEVIKSGKLPVPSEPSKEDEE
jgi:hypothetical protein